jgi:UDP-N-acetylmuramate dehydrogenase
MQYRSINFAQYSSFKIGPTLDVAILDTNTKDIANYHLIGACNNILIGENPPPLIMLSKEYDYIKIEQNRLKIGAATPSGKIASFCKKNNIANFEFLSHLPGKLGGLVFMNAGLKEFEIFNHLIDITTLCGKYEKEKIAYGYRYTNIQEPILEANFALEYGFDATKVATFKKMRANQPSTPSAGSCFKNPPGDYAGRLIEAVGLKGVMRGDMCFSHKHANFLVNNGAGNFRDALFLINAAQKRVFEMFGVELELEIEILDREYLNGTKS